MNLDPKANHAINLALLAIVALLITYNHFAAAGWHATPINLAEYAPLGAMLGQYWTSLQAGQSESTKWISPAQVALIWELAAERGLEAEGLRAFIQGRGLPVLASLTRAQGSEVIIALKGLPEKKG